jgi:hypothetical protein
MGSTSEYQVELCLIDNFFHQTLKIKCAALRKNTMISLWPKEKEMKAGRPHKGAKWGTVNN